MSAPDDSTTSGNPTTADIWGGSAEWSHSSRKSRSSRADAYNPRLSLLEQCQAMIRYGSTSGIRLPLEAVNIVDKARTAALSPELGVQVPLSSLAEAHRLLAAAVAPATPSTIQLLADEQTDSFWRYLGATRYARYLSVIATILFIGFVVLQMSLAPPGGSHRFLDVVVTALASLVGGIFYVMFAMSRQLAGGSFNRSLEGQYTVLIILGGLAGMALAFFIVRPATGSGSADGATIDVLLTRPLLALLGGFSARAVYRILERLAATVEALIKGSGDDMVAAQEQAAQARAAAEALKSKGQTVQTSSSSTPR